MVSCLSKMNPLPNFVVPYKSQFSKYVPDLPPADIPVYVGKQVYHIETTETRGTYLSNNYVIIPHHSWSGPCTKLRSELYEEEAADLSIVVCSSVFEKKSLYPAAMYHDIPKKGISFELSVMNNTIIKFNEVANFIYTFEFEHELKSGDSGTLIMGTTTLKEKTSKKDVTVHSALFMVIARSQDQYKLGLAIYLPVVLAYIRYRDLYPTMNKPEIVQFIDMALWQLISTPGEIKKQALALGPKMIDNFQAKVNQNNAIDKALLDYVDGRKSSRKFMKLYYGFSMAVDNHDGAGTDMCWVIDYECQHHTSSNGYYRAVGLAMQEAKITNCAPRGKKRFNTYIGSTVCITVDKKSYKNYKIGTTYFCHHPFLCELNDNCRGVQKGANGTTSILTHCCIRPSHLVGLNKHFNDLGIVLQPHVDDDTKQFYYEKRNTTVSW